jgi:hypothetical protein
MFTDRQLTAAIHIPLALAVAGAIAVYKSRDVAPYSRLHFDANYLEPYNKQYFDATFAAFRNVPHAAAPAWFSGTFGSLDPVSPSRSFETAPVVAAGQ